MLFGTTHDRAVHPIRLNGSSMKKRAKDRKNTNKWRNINWVIWLIPCLFYAHILSLFFSFQFLSTFIRTVEIMHHAWIAFFIYIVFAYFCKFGTHLARLHTQSVCVCVSLFLLITISERSCWFTVKIEWMRLYTRRWSEIGWTSWFHEYKTIYNICIADSCIWEMSVSTSERFFFLHFFPEILLFQHSSFHHMADYCPVTSKIAPTCSVRVCASVKSARSQPP